MKKDAKLNKKLAAYSAAAAAALAIAPAANAAVVYSGLQNLTVNTANSHYIDMNNDGTDDFYIAVSTITSIGLSAAYIVSTTGGFGHIAETIHSDPARLPYGYTIQNSLAGPTNYWTSSEWNTLNGTVFGSTSSMGNFRGGAQGYIGVRFSDATCRTAYGWIQYQGTGIATGTIIDWAYEDGCGPIQAGFAAAATVPTMGEWGMLLLAGLLSAAGIKAINRERETA